MEKPVPKDDEVLIGVHAVSLNGSDWECLTGKPLYARYRGFLKPKYHVLGSDVAGRVEAVGRSVRRLQPGDDVFGDIMACMGGFAEFVSVPEKLLTRKPAGMTHEEVACLPQGACIALQGIRDKGRVRPGDKVLINGGGGSAGAFAIQIAKSKGAEGKLDLMRAPASARTSAPTCPGSPRPRPGSNHPDNNVRRHPRTSSNLSPCNCSVRRIRFLQIWRKSKTGQIICYIDRSYRVLATASGIILDEVRVPA